MDQGRYYDLRYKNVNNPFCSCDSKENSNSDCNDSENIRNSSEKSNINGCERLEKSYGRIERADRKIKNKSKLFRKTLVDNMNT